MGAEVGEPRLQHNLVCWPQLDFCLDMPHHRGRSFNLGESAAREISISDPVPHQKLRIETSSSSGMDQAHPEIEILGSPEANIEPLNAHEVLAPDQSGAGDNRVLLKQEAGDTCTTTDGLFAEEWPTGLSDIANHDPIRPDQIQIVVESILHLVRKEIVFPNIITVKKGTPRAARHDQAGVTCG